MQVEVTGNVSIPLTFIRGSHVYFIVVLQAFTAINGADVKLDGFLICQGIPVVLPTNEEGLGGGASMMKNGGRVKYLIKLSISEDFPVMNGVIRLVLKNRASGKLIISFDMPIFWGICLYFRGGRCCVA